MRKNSDRGVCYGKAKTENGVSVLYDAGERTGTCAYRR